GLVAGFTERSLEVTLGNWKTELRARGGEETDLLWIALAQFWGPAMASPGADNANPAKAKFYPDKIVLGRRTEAEPTKWLITVGGGTDGVYTLTGVGFASVSFEASSKTAEEIRDALIAAWNGSDTLNGPTLAAATGETDELTITTDTDG